MAVEDVEGDDGLLMSILVWLQPILLLTFRCVSKRWKNIIDDRFFRESYRLRTRDRQLYHGGGRILGFIHARSHYRHRSGLRVPESIKMLLPVAQMNDLHIMQIPRKLGYFTSSSNGLILCRYNIWNDGRNYFHFQVVNPLTRTSVELPAHNLKSTSMFGFACEENIHELVPSIRIVGVVLDEHLEQNNTMLIETYSSETGKWTTSSLIGTEWIDVNTLQEPYVSSNCVFHWPGKEALVVYDPSEDENHVQMIKVPEMDRFADLEVTRSSNDDVIWICEMDDRSLKFWKLPKDESCGGYKRTTTINANEWILMHMVDNQSLFNYATFFVGLNKRRKVYDEEGNNNYRSYCYSLERRTKLLVLEKFDPGNHMAVFLSDKLSLFRYDLKSKSIEFIEYHGVPFHQKYHCAMHPYVEPLSLSPFALSGDTYNE